ncbi:hypothetical protein FOXYSP1_20699 [Fusarium oxysporum f. sp. phaseoli]
MPYCRGWSCIFRAAKRAVSHVGPVRRAQEVEQVTAAGVVRAGSVKLQIRVRVGSPPIVKQQDAANVVWADEAAEGVQWVNALRLQ